MTPIHWRNWILLLVIFHDGHCQQTASSLGDFVKQLTTFISQNGGIGSLVNAIPRPGGEHPGQGGYPYYPKPDGFPQEYPEYASQYPDGSYEDLRPSRPPYRPPFRPHYPPGPGYAPDYPGQGYPPDYPGQGYRPDYPGQGYRPDYPGQGYPPDYPGPGFKPGYPPALPPGYYDSYPQQGLMAALGSIARHDDLRCVPRLLCEVTSGGKPGYPSYSTSGQQTAKDTIATLLTVLNFMDDNPLFIFGRAALLGAASRGNSEACLNAYPTCPRDPDRLVHYLNNHNGGFFRFFGGLPGQQRGLDEGSTSGKDDVKSEDGEARIQSRPQTGLYSPYPTRQPHFLNSVEPAQATDYLPSSAHGADYGPSDRIVFPSDSSDNRKPGRGGKQLQFPQDNSQDFSSSRPSYTSDLSFQYKPDFSPPQNLINFRDQRSVRFPSSMNFPRA